ncbi:hypothetical protein AB0M28_06555 [Streptomyces sp. NPDC051940]|uniref:hypothetical protein n=1 Tax=Streptomyces sp. NPDC051940 TaxID=3155675 RepID=UPI00341CA79C
MEESPAAERLNFQPSRPFTSGRKAVAFLLGGVVWVGAFWLGIVLLGHTYILRRLLVVTAVSAAVACVALLGGFAMRRREERDAPH